MNGLRLVKEHLKQNKIANKYDPFKRYCECGHSVYIPSYVEFIICHHCGEKIYYDKEKQKKEIFKRRMRRKLNEK